MRTGAAVTLAAALMAAISAGDDGAIVWSHDTGGGVHGWLSVVDDEVFVPVGNASPPSLPALGLTAGDREPR